MHIKKALLNVLKERRQPIVTYYALFNILRNLYAAGELSGERLRTRSSRPRKSQLERYLKQLLAERYLREDADFGSDAFRVSDVPDGPAEEITALVDPFCYLSHLSAMQRYGLTVRAPEPLILSTPKDWKAARIQQEQTDYGLFADEDYIVPLRQIRMPEIVRGRLISLHVTKRGPQIKSIKGSAARIAAVGEVFVQMLDRPELCGGIPHILDVWAEHARTYLDEIITAVDRAPEKIVKVRAGYILDEWLGANDQRIENWLSFAQRGGSRLLDPSRPYVSKYSEKWMISLNVDPIENSPQRRA